MALRELSPAEARVLAVLVEKQHTVPDTYPLSLNSLVAGCNQKSARDPVMNLSEAEVLRALDELKSLSLVVESSGSRVSRYEHNFPRGAGVPSQSAALLATLMLRGPQTAAELRANSERLHRFADISSVEAFLQELAEREPVRVVRLPRAPGAREQRWMHLLCGPVDASVAAGVPAAASSAAAGAGEVAALAERQAQLEAEVGELRALVERLYQELGVSRA
ncbi:YceH family protein [Caldimonas tepidiphila]|uniref:YceH family protein n=1 Tax=Caldimonas tepidiphila TaxID=2315841 RepID=UPI000E5C399D|nr:YceH family protein [Caldimonas tepidiphila]